MNEYHNLDLKVARNSDRYVGCILLDDIEDNRCKVSVAYLIELGVDEYYCHYYFSMKITLKMVFM